MRGPIRVLVVDDSALMRKLIPQILSRDLGIEVVGTAMDGTFVLKKIEELKPDVITLDLKMPRMDGIETLREVMKVHPLPVIVVSAHSQQGATAAMKALSLGAFDFVAKPVDAPSGNLNDIATELVEKIRIAANANVSKAPRELRVPQKPRKAAPNENARPTKVVAIGISTGGPNALQLLFSELPPDFPATILVVQHMPEGFTEMFARRLDESSSIQVKEAKPGDLLLAGRALICPGNQHMKVRRMPLGEIVVLENSAPVNGHRPSVDVLFHSVAHHFPGHSIGVLMTGMGEDGAEGMGSIKASGGFTVAQSEETCVVAGMPKAAVDRGYVDKVAPLEMLARLICKRCATDAQNAKGEATAVAQAAARDSGLEKE
ncbi:MAG: protein-glutamate methylesterase/protein-glutamine glutaminase [Candidatus Acidiferrales bacterium]